LTEISEGGSDFLAQVVRAWERSVDEVAALGIRTVKLRTGIVLTMEGGALPKLVQPSAWSRCSAGIGGSNTCRGFTLTTSGRMYVQAVTMSVAGDL
jgi:NAD dependent epimerase/dehydratase family enzyme